MNRPYGEVYCFLTQTLAGRTYPFPCPWWDEEQAALCVRNVLQCIENTIMECLVDNELLWKCDHQAVRSIMEIEQGDDQMRKHQLYNLILLFCYLFITYLNVCLLIKCEFYDFILKKIRQINKQRSRSCCCVRVTPMKEQFMVFDVMSFAFLVLGLYSIKPTK